MFKKILVGFLLVVCIVKPQPYLGDDLSGVENSGLPSYVWYWPANKFVKGSDYFHQIERTVLFKNRPKLNRPPKILVNGKSLSSQEWLPFLKDKGPKVSLKSRRLGLKAFPESLRNN